jgi:hypothetical protein
VLNSATAEEANDPAPHDESQIHSTGRMRLPLFWLILTLAAACSSTASSSTDASRASTGCVPLASVAASCPPDWAAAMAAHGAFCAKEAPLFEAFLSKAPCRGRLHYTRYLFDGGPRYCVYDPATKKLSGYAAFDGKAMFRQVSCGVDEADFSDVGCDGEGCPKDGRDGGASAADAGASTVPVRCDVVDQNCPAGNRCDFFCEDGLVVIGCVPESPAPTPVGQSCPPDPVDAGTGISRCIRGSGCFGSSHAPAACVQYCRPGSPCPAGTTCDTTRIKRTICPRTAGDLPVGLCL